MYKLIRFLTLFCWLMAKIIWQNNFKNIFTAKGTNKQIAELN